MPNDIFKTVQISSSIPIYFLYSQKYQTTSDEIDNGLQFSMHSIFDKMDIYTSRTPTWFYDQSVAILCKIKSYYYRVSIDINYYDNGASGGFDHYAYNGAVCYSNWVVKDDWAGPSNFFYEIIFNDTDSTEIEIIQIGLVSRSGDFEDIPTNITNVNDMKFTIEAPIEWVPNFNFDNEFNKLVETSSGVYSALKDFTKVKFYVDNLEFPGYSRLSLSTDSNYKESIIKFYDSTAIITPDNNSLSSNLNKTGSLTATATIFDARGRSTTKTKTIQVSKMPNPSFVKQPIIERCDNDGDSNPDGERIKFIISTSCTNYMSTDEEPVSTGNYIDHIKCYYKPFGSDDNAWTTDTAVNQYFNKYGDIVATGGITTSSEDDETEERQPVDSIHWEGVTTAYKFDTQTQYDVKVVVTDAYGGTCEATDVITKSQITIDLKNGGHGIAFGKQSEKDGFECDIESWFTKKATFNETVNAPKLNFPKDTRYSVAGRQTFARVYVDSDNSKPYYRIATTGRIENSYNDRCSIYLVGGNYHLAPWALIKCESRTNDMTNTTSGYGYCNGRISVLANSGFPMDAFQLRIRNAKGNSLVDLYFKCPATWGSIIITELEGGNRNTLGEGGFTLLKNVFTYKEDSRSDMNADSYTDTVTMTYTATVGNADTLDGIHSSGFIRSVNANGYYGMARPSDGNTSDWIRTTSAGILPHSTGKPGTGSLGTDSWRFNNIYGANIFGKTYTTAMSDYPVASGTSGDWQYIKFASKLAICWMRRTDSLNATKSWGSCYVSSILPARSYPFTFSSKPWVSIVIDGDNGSLWTTMTGEGTTTQSPKWYAVSSGSYSSTSCHWGILAIGPYS